MKGFIFLLISAFTMKYFCYSKKEYRLALLFLLLTNGASFILSGVLDDFYVYNILAFICLTVSRIASRLNYRSLYSYIFFLVSYLIYALDDILLNNIVLSNLYYPLYYLLTAYLVWSVSNVYRIRRGVAYCLRELGRIAFGRRSVTK